MSLCSLPQVCTWCVTISNGMGGLVCKVQKDRRSGGFARDIVWTYHPPVQPRLGLNINFDHHRCPFLAQLDW